MLAKGDEDAPDPKLSLGAAGAAPEEAGFEPPRTLVKEPPPEDADPNRLGFPAPPNEPNGEVDELASLAKPELAKAEVEVCD